MCSEFTKTDNVLWTFHFSGFKYILSNNATIETVLHFYFQYDTLSFLHDLCDDTFDLFGFACNINKVI